MATHQDGGSAQEFRVPAQRPQSPPTAPRSADSGVARGPLRVGPRLAPLRWPANCPEWRIPFYIRDSTPRARERCANAVSQLDELVVGLEFIPNRRQAYLILDGSATPEKARQIAVAAREILQQVVYDYYVERLPKEQRNLMREQRLRSLNGLVDFPEEILDAILEVASVKHHENPNLEHDTSSSITEEELLNSLEEVIEAGARKNPQRPSDALGVIAMRASELEQAKTALAGAVESARAQGYSWAGIGDVLGISGEAARKRWDPTARQKHADAERARVRRRGQTPD